MTLPYELFFAWSIAIIGAAYLTGIRVTERRYPPRIRLTKLRFGYLAKEE